MNRWVLLEHTTFDDHLSNIHYDFLVEDHNDCLTWKLYNIPKLDKGSIQIRKSANHRLVWLSRIDYKLSNNRGLVKRIDYGTYNKISYRTDPMEFKLALSGQLLKGCMTIGDESCQLTRDN